MPTPRGCIPPKLFGRLSTSRSSTSTSQPSPSSTRKSPPSVSPSPSSANESKAEPDSIGGQIQSLRINQPELVSDGRDRHSEKFVRRDFAYDRRMRPPLAAS